MRCGKGGGGGMGRGRGECNVPLGGLDIEIVYCSSSQYTAGSKSELTNGLAVVVLAREEGNRRAPGAEKALRHGL